MAEHLRRGRAERARTTGSTDGPTEGAGRRGARRASRFLRRLGGTGRRRTVMVGAAGVAVLLAVGGGAYALNRSPATRYTTATAQTGTVTQTVAGAGTVASVSSATVAFQVAGTVGSVEVAVGDQVTAGQALATLDPASLDEAVATAQQRLDDARQQLADDQSAQQSTGTTGSSGTSGSTGSSAGSSGTSGTAPSGTDPGISSAPTDGGSAGTGATGTGTSVSAEMRGAVAEVAAAQQALLSAYADAAAAQVASAAALATLSSADSTSWCSDLVALDPAQVTVESAAPTGADPADEDPAAAGTTTGDPTSSGTSLSTVQDWVAACQAALTELGGLQTATDTAQTALSSAMADLDAKVAVLQQLVESSGDSGAAGPAGTGSAGSSQATQDQPVVQSQQTTQSQQADPSQTSGSSGTASPSGAADTGLGSRSSVPTAADLVADQAAVDAAEAALAVAEADLQLATITTPLTGTVAAVDLAVGDQVTAGSTTATVTVLGDAGFQVSLPVDLGSIDVVQVGQPATVTVPSSDQTLDGTVTSIGVLDVSTTSTPQYTVTIRLESTDAPLFDGSSAQVTITVAGVTDVLTVPTSAVHVDGTTVTVDVLSGGQVSAVEVARGAVGPELTEISDGLSAGDSVVLADRSQPMQEDETSQTQLGGTGGEFPGGQSGFQPGGQMGSFQRSGG